MRPGKVLVMDIRDFDLLDAHRTVLYRVDPPVETYFRGAVSGK
jgi:hypothetical protein